MRKTYLGELEEIVLLTVALLYKEEAYGVAITQKLIELTSREISISAVHATLHRLEEKGFLRSMTGGATAERGGRSNSQQAAEAKELAAKLAKRHEKRMVWSIRREQSWERRGSARS